MKKFCVSTLLLLVLVAGVQAQSNPTDTNLLRKYWNYRDRFLDRFVRIGDLPGYSMPVEDYWFSDCRWDWVWWNYPPALIRDGQGMLVPGGDQTCNLGHYIGLLATEHYLLAQNGQPTDSVRRELYFALKAYYRLEREANEIFGNSDYFGYYLRQDAPNDLHVDFLDDRVPENRNPFCTLSEEVQRQYSPDSLVQNFTSQDQTIHLLYGMALVKRCIPPDVRYNGESLLELAQEASRRMVFRFYTDGWNLKNPRGQEVGNERGGQAWPWAYAFDKTWAYINNTGQTFGDYTYNLADVTLKNLYQCCGHLGGITHFYNRRLFISLTSTGNTKTVTYNFNYTFNDGLWIYPVTQCILHNLRLDSVQETELLDSLYSIFLQAPAIGPCININGQNPDCVNTKGWVGQNRWFGNKDTRDTITDTNNHPADHNGLDYLLAYNLYRIYTNPNGYYNINAPALPTAIGQPKQQQPEWRIFPNPGKGSCFLEFDLATAAEVSVRVFDLNGSLVLNVLDQVHHPAGNHRESLDLSGLPASAYMLQLLVNGNVFHEKLIRL